MKIERMTAAELEQFRLFSTCVIASAIETFHVRLPNTGFTHSSIQCIFPKQPAIVGYAATARIRSASPPMDPHTTFDYYERADWWNNILSIPAPRIVVIEDADRHPGLGAFIGAVHANILLALGCVGVVTNGAVRDLPDIELTEFQLFAGNVAVSHAYAHLFDFGGEVEVGSLKVKPGDLLHGDRHGVQTVPLEVASRVPAVAREILARRQEIMGLRRSNSFSIGEIQHAIQRTRLPLVGEGGKG